MSPDMRVLLERLLHERGEQEFRSKPVLEIKECQGSIDSACKKLGIRRFTHHDLRHLFATRCIESGVDIPTVSRWLGHRDGGALAMKTYGHLRDQHSAAMAKKVLFKGTMETAPATSSRAPGEVGTQAESGPTSTLEPTRKDISKAKAKYDFPWWASDDPAEVFWGQMQEPVQIVPTDKLRACAVRAMGREVFATELADKEALMEEFIERTGENKLPKIGKSRPM
jgi:hypothetical protein